MTGETMDRERLKTLAEQVAVDFPRAQDIVAYSAIAHPQAILALLAELERVERERDAANRTLVTHAEQVLRLGQILKPLGYEKGTTFDEIARDCVAAEAENARLRAALEMIAGRRQCLDNLMSNVDIARAAITPAGRPTP